MPSLTKPIGSNIRPGMTRGGFTAPLTEQRKEVPRSHHNPTYRQIRDAATQALAKRGITQAPDAWNCAGGVQ